MLHVVEMSDAFLTLGSMCCIATSQKERLMAGTAAWNMPIPTVPKSPKGNAALICFVLLELQKSGGL